MEEEYTQMNVNVSIDDVRKVDIMAKEEGLDSRSAFIRRIIRREWMRRYQKPEKGEEWQYLESK